ncbi:RICIN domain-containing protein [Streptomyces sp. NPDC051907]|uniref:RICIN domain-containing protein n=1 Tax=Streptomyces sp. NPDC051907 TaxID=3155284 RepID=UPI003417604C
MSRTIRAALAVGASAAALIGSATTAHADQSMARAAADGASFVRLQAEHSGKCLTIENGSLADRTRAVQSTCDDSLAYQLFRLVPTGSATFEVRAKHSGRCLSTGPHYEWETGQEWCFDSSSQRWSVIMVEVAKEVYELRPVDAPDYCLTVHDASLNDGVGAYIGRCSGITASRWRIQPVTP